MVIVKVSIDTEPNSSLFDTMICAYLTPFPGKVVNSLTDAEFILMAIVLLEVKGHSR